MKHSEAIVYRLLMNTHKYNMYTHTGTVVSQINAHMQQFLSGVTVLITYVAKNASYNN